MFINQISGFQSPNLEFYVRGGIIICICK